MRKMLFILVGPEGQYVVHHLLRQWHVQGCFVGSDGFRRRQWWQYAVGFCL